MPLDVSDDGTEFLIISGGFIVGFGAGAWGCVLTDSCELEML